MGLSIWQYAQNVLKQEVKAQYTADKESEVRAELEAIINRIFQQKFSKFLSGRELNDSDVEAIGGLIEGIAAVIENPEHQPFKKIYPMLISFDYEMPNLGERHGKGRMEIVFGYEHK